MKPQTRKFLLLYFGANLAVYAVWCFVQAHGSERQKKVCSFLAIVT
jgi:hypothetical protein